MIYDLQTRDRELQVQQARVKELEDWKADAERKLSETRERLREEVERRVALEERARTAELKGSGPEQS